MKSKNIEKGSHAEADIIISAFLNRYIAFAQQHSAYIQYLSEQYPDYIADIHAIDPHNFNDLRQVIFTISAFQKEITSAIPQQIMPPDDFEAQLYSFAHECCRYLFLPFEVNIHDCKKDIKALTALLKKVEKYDTPANRNAQKAALIAKIRKKIKANREQLVIYELNFAVFKTNVPKRAFIGLDEAAEP